MFCTLPSGFCSISCTCGEWLAFISGYLMGNFNLASDNYNCIFNSMLFTECNVYVNKVNNISVTASSPAALYSYMNNIAISWIAALYYTAACHFMSLIGAALLHNVKRYVGD